VKKRTKVLVGAMAAVVLVLMGVFVWLDQIAKTAIEVGATQALGVPTQLDKARIGIFSGQFRLSGLKIANPPGFDSDHFLSLDEGELIVSPTALLQDTVVVSKLAFSGIDMNLEKKGKQDNYGVILENLNKQTGETEPEEETPDPEPPEQGKKFVIEEVLIRDIAVHADLIPIGGDISRVTFRIPEIRLENIGSESDGGVVMAELSGVLMQAIFKAVIEKGGDLIPGNMIKGLSAGLQGLEDLSVQVVGEVGKAAQEAGQAMGKTVEEVGKGMDEALKGIEGLFKKEEPK